MEERIKGRHIELVPIVLEDRGFFFEQVNATEANRAWFFGDSTQEHITEEQFEKQWTSLYFKDEENEKGRCFHIIKDSNRIGQVHYNVIDNKQVDLDLIIYDSVNHSKGYGTSAIKLLSAYLEEKFHVEQIWIDLHNSNVPAIKAYQKAGFDQIKETENGIARLSRIR